MQLDRFKQLEQLVHATLEQEPAQRNVFLHEACHQDEELEREALALLSAQSEASDFLENPAEVLGEGINPEELPSPLLNQSLGPYKVLQLLGRGGMGEVYLAEDTRLERKVALKLLPEEFSHDRDRLERFRREAHAASALNHPNILTIHEIGEFEERIYLVTEYIEGQTLRQRLAEGRLDLKETLEIGSQITSALVAAHQVGIVHRDLKPENIMLRPDGLVKVLDFGLAKLTPTGPTAAAHTQTGILLGTVAYMSPEQARGQKVDGCSDLFSLGVVLYEMVAGERPFYGPTSSDTLVAILEREPARLEQHRAGVPEVLQQIVAKALAKDPADRYQAASDLRIDLERLRRDTKPGRMAITEKQGRKSEQRRPARKWKPAMVSLVLISLLGIVVTWLVRRAAWPGPPIELKETRLTANSSENGVSLALISPDGKYLAYSEQTKLYLKLIETGEVRPIRQPEGLTAENTSWMVDGWFPDGTRFLATRSDAARNYSTWVISVFGMPPRLLRDNTAYGIPSPDGSHVVYLAGTFSGGAASELWLMDAQGGSLRKVLTAPEGCLFKWPAWSPASQRIAYLRFHGNETSIESCDLKGEKLTTILSDPRLNVISSAFCWFPNGRMILTAVQDLNQDDSILCEIQVDPKTGDPRGKLRRITKWTGHQVGVVNGTTDGKRLVFMRFSWQSDVFVGEWDPGSRYLKNPRRLTFDERQDFLGTWTRDSQAVLFSSNRNGQFEIFKQEIDQEIAVPVVTGPGNKFDPVLSPDGNLILYTQEESGGKIRIMRVPISGGAREMVLEGRGINGMTCLRCSTFPATLCVFGEESPDRKQYIFTEFDPMRGRGQELISVTLRQPVPEYWWDLARDGSRLAFVQDQAHPRSQFRIQILPLTGGEAGEIVVKRDIHMTSLDWANDNRGFFVGAGGLTGLLLFVDLDGRVDVLWKRETLYGVGPQRILISPDGRHLVMTGSTIENNAWMLENF